MTIAAADREIGSLIKNFKTYGAEVVINALVRTCRGEPYLKKDDILRMIDSAYKRIEERQD